MSETHPDWNKESEVGLIPVSAAQVSQYPSQEAVDAGVRIRRAIMDVNSLVISNWSRILKAAGLKDELSRGWSGITVYIQSGNLSH